MEEFQTLPMIFSKQLYIPNYQRSYVWTSNIGVNPGEVVVFWEDLKQFYSEQLKNKTTEIYYLGSFIIHDDGKKEYLIDGQQRAITITILFKVIKELVDILREESEEIRAQSERVDEFIGNIRLILGSFITEKKMSLHLAKDINSFFFKEIITKTEIDRRTLEKNSRGKKKKTVKTVISEAQENLIKAKKRLYSLLEQYLDSSCKTPVEKYETLESFGQLLNESIKIAIIKKTTTEEAHRVFETINSRGKPLSQADLLKNYLFSKLASDSADDEIEIDNLDDDTDCGIEKGWRILASELTGNELTQFIRYYWVSNNPNTTEAQLFRTISNSKTKPEELKELLNALRKHKKIYSFMIKGTHGELIEDNSVRSILTEIRMLGYSIHAPLVFAMIDKSYENEQIVKLLELFEIYFVRNNTIAGSSTNTIWPLIVEISNKISKNDATDTFDTIYNDTFEKMTNGQTTTIESNSAIKNKLENMTFKNDDVPRVLLKRLEVSESLLDYSNISLEHILPQTPKKGEWSEFADPKIHSLYCYKIGNMALLTIEQNSKVGNKEYEEKRKLYQSFEEKIVKNIAEKYSKWTKESIDQNSKEIAKKILQKWPVPQK